MSVVWKAIFVAMVCGSVLKYFFKGTLTGVGIDLAVLFVAYFILRRFHSVNLKWSLIFLTVIKGSVMLVNLEIINGVLGSIIVIGAVGWLVLGPGYKMISAE
ncbi:hypothetical protein [Sporomusa sp. KB1]|uniref:hypothetical protein n=1 Tax=Sporomusa sp. KB1 TaxID=943346 RepID=UPI0011AA8C60|nr:hypothetical protein [Sporomusa sp. KB1]TWH45509.1 hypothetical protein Salpa_1422 [Sporomusa sp. KB1]